MIEPNSRTIEFQIQGMSCAACVGRVERAIKKIPEVADASVNLATERALVSLRTDEASNIDQVITAIHDAGYSAKAIPRIQDQDTQSNPIRRESDTTTQSLQRDFWIAMVFALPIFLISMAPMLWPPLMDKMMQTMSMHQWNWFLWFLASIVQFGPGLRFYRNAYHSLRNWSPDMNFLVAMGTTAAYGLSTIITFFPNWLVNHQQHVYFESSAVVICLVLLGKYLEARSKRSTQDALYGLAKLQPQSANKQTDEQTIQVPISDISVGDHLVVFEGQAIPLDGKIVRGSSFIQEGMVTGEPIPKEKTIGDAVIGGTVNGNGQLTIRVTATGQNTFLARMTSMVIEAQSKKPPIQSALDRIIRIFAPLVVLLAIATAIGWWILSSDSGFEKGLLHAVAVLVVACPCALGLASPLSMMVGSGRAAELGILFRSHEAIQKLAQINSIVFDKTGTLTTGKPSLAGAWPCHDPANTPLDNQLLGLASLAAKSSNHPIALAIRHAAKEQRSNALVLETQAVAGKGVRVKLSDQRRLSLGSYAWMKEQQLTNEQTDQLQRSLAEQGYSISWLALGDALLGAFGVNDPLKPEAKEMIASLKTQGLKIAVLSGDQSASVEQIANALEIQRWHA